MTLELNLAQIKSKCRPVTDQSGILLANSKLCTHRVPIKVSRGIATLGKVRL